MSRQLSRNEYISIGSKAAMHLDPVTKFEDIGAVMGMSRQGAQYFCHLALGKLVHGLRRELAQDIAIYNRI